MADDSTTPEWKKKTRAAGQSLSDSGQSEMDQSRVDSSSRIGSVSYNSYKRGGKVKKTERALVHKGELVVPRGKVKKVERMMKRKSSGR